MAKNEKYTVFVAMRNKITSFDMQSTVFAELEAAYPEMTFHYFDSRTDMVERLDEADFILTWRFDRSWYAKAKKLKAIFTPAAGRDWVAADPTGNVTTNHGTFHGVMIAESLLGMMMLFNNKYLSMSSLQKIKHWDANHQTGRSLLRNQQVLIIGYGHIGETCGCLLQQLGCSVTGIKRQLTKNYATRVVTVAELEKELPEADHVVIILPSGSETDGFFKYDYFKLMKPTAHVYNFGRGNAIHEADLVTALENQEIAGAGLDVFEQEPLPAQSPLWEMGNVFMTPHSSCCYQEYGHLFATEVKDKLVNYL